MPQWERTREAHLSHTGNSKPIRDDDKQIYDRRDGSEYSNDLAIAGLANYDDGRTARPSMAGSPVTQTVFDEIESGQARRLPCVQSA
jgi:hypothetical protein